MLVVTLLLTDYATGTGLYKKSSKFWPYVFSGLLTLGLECKINYWYYLRQKYAKYGKCKIKTVESKWLRKQQIDRNYSKHH